MMKKNIIDIAILFCFLCISLITFSNIISKDYFTYDEADYMFAVSKGIFANYIDQNAIPITTFIKQGLEKGTKKEKTTSLSEMIRSSNDITFYRHYHGPLSFYALAFLENFLGSSEHMARFISYLTLLLSIVAIYAGCYFLCNENARLSAVFSSLFLVSSLTNSITAAQITPHGLYVLMVIITLVLIAKLLQSNDVRYLYYAVIALAFSFMVIEYALLLLFTLVACLVINRRQLFENWSRKDFQRHLQYLIGLFLGVILLVWPGGLLKLSLLKNYVFFTYFVIVRGGAYGAQSVWHVWLDRIIGSPAIFALIIIATVVALFKVKRYKWYSPFIIYAFLVFITTFRNTSPSPTYISSLLPPLFILSGMVIANVLSKTTTLTRSFTTVVIIVIMFFSSFIQIKQFRSNVNSHTWLKNIVDYIKDEQLYNKKILIDRDLLPTIHYYLPDERFSSFSKKSENHSSIVKKLLTSPYDGILYAGDNYSALEQELQKHFNIEPTLIAGIPGLKRKAIYCKLSKM